MYLQQKKEKTDSKDFRLRLLTLVSKAKKLSLTLGSKLCNIFIAVFTENVECL